MEHTYNFELVNQNLEKKKHLIENGENRVIWNMIVIPLIFSSNVYLIFSIKGTYVYLWLKMQHTYEMN
jgi:hypothetical protein